MKKIHRMFLLMLVLLFPAIAAGAQPYPNSSHITSFSINTNDLSNEYGQESDLWPMTWDSNGDLFAVWGDGDGFQRDSGSSSWGVVKISGSPPSGLDGDDRYQCSRVPDPNQECEGKVNGGIVAIGTTLYLYKQMQDTWDVCDLYKSTDGGENFSKVTRIFTSSELDFASPGVIQFGPGYTAANDSYIYLYGFNRSSKDELYLARVHISEIENPSAYEYFSGTSAAPAWSSDYNNRTAIWQNSAASELWGANAVWHPESQRYLLSLRHNDSAGWGLYDAPEPWGPWTTVFYDENNWIDSTKKFTFLFPQKWRATTSGDTGYMVFSGVSTYDSFTVLPYTMSWQAATSDPAVDDDGDGYSENQGDCNDVLAGIYPGAEEICGDGIDQDCSGADLTCEQDSLSVDDDGDGYSENEGDCNDTLAGVYPGSNEICGDGIDQDCSGSDLPCSTDSTVSVDSPQLLFSDLASGCLSCVSDDQVTNQGAIVTVWGRNLGSSKGNSEVYVGTEGNWRAAAHVYYWCNADGGASGGGPANLYAHHGLQEIAFAVPSNTPIGDVKIKIVVDGVDSNTLDFHVRDSGNAYFVKNSGSDSSGDGSWSSPWKTIDHVAVSAEPTVTDGDIVYLWGDVGTTNSEGRWTIKRMVGSEKNRIAYVAYPGQTPKVYSTSNGFKNYDNSCDYIVLSKIKIMDMGSSNSHFPHSRIVGIQYNGDRTEGGLAFFTGSGQQSGTKYYGMHLENYGEGTSNKDHTLYFTVRGEGPIDAWEVGWSYFRGNQNRGCLWFYDENDMGVINGTVKWHDNIIVDQVGPAIYVLTGNSNGTPGYSEGTFHVYNNLIVGASKMSDAGYFEMNSVAIGGPQNYCDVKIYNNTFYGFSYSGCSDGAGHDNCAFLVVRDNFKGTWEWVNNIVVDLYDLSYSDITTSGIPPTAASNNIWYFDGEKTAPSWDSAPRISNPSFRNQASDNFRLQEGSPAIDSGSQSVGAIVVKDMDGLVRANYGSIDIGSYEFAGAGSFDPLPDAPTGLRIVSNP